MRKGILLVAALLVLLLLTVAYAQIPYPVGYATGPGGDTFATATTVVKSASTNYTVPKGTWFVIPDVTYGLIQVNTTGTTWANMAATGVSMFLFSDGAMVRILGGPSTATHTLIKMR